MDLPSLDLSKGPIRHTDCCLSLSAKLFDTLIDIFATDNAQTSSTVLSIGSGSGLLEVAFNDHIATFRTKLMVHGVEVQQADVHPPVNKYLPEQCHHTVRGTRDLSSQLSDDDVVGLMFIFPRQPDLLSRYIDAATKAESSVKRVVWLGPVVDWEDFSRCFERDASAGLPQKVDIRRGDEAGLAEYEMMAILYV